MEKTVSQRISEASEDRQKERKLFMEVFADAHRHGYDVGNAHPKGGPDGHVWIHILPANGRVAEWATLTGVAERTQSGVIVPIVQHETYLRKYAHARAMCDALNGSIKIGVPTGFCYRGQPNVSQKEPTVSDKDPVGPID